MNLANIGQWDTVRLWLPSNLLFFGFDFYTLIISNGQSPRVQTSHIDTMYLAIYIVYTDLQSQVYIVLRNAKVVLGTWPIDRPCSRVSIGKVDFNFVLHMIVSA
jgi:hypothetical protein